MTGKVTQRIKGSSENQEYNKLMALTGMSDSEILTDSDSDSDSDFFCR